MRVARSPTFQKTWRLRELLLFLGDRALREPGAVVREQEIAEAVFGRGPEFDPLVDGLVRVQIVHLRRRLRQHFGAEGRAEPTVIEIPRGVYTPVFRPREGAGGPAESDGDVDAEADLGVDLGVEPAPRLGAAGRRWIVGLGAGVLALVVLAVFLFVQNRRLPSARGGPAPSVQRLWRDLFDNGRPVRVVTADGGLTVFLDVTRRDMTAAAYQRRDSAASYGLADPLADASAVEVARRFLPQPYTSAVDADLAYRAGRVLAAAGIAGEVVRAREATPETFRSANAVLSGPRRSNPWVELFEDRLSFRSRHDRREGRGYFTNRAPRPGEAKEYSAVADKEGYCRVAHVPSLDGTGSILLVTGTDIPSTQAGVELVTREAEVEGLRRTLGLGPRERFPRFEVLLRVRLADGAMDTSETVAHRREGVSR